MALRCIDNDYRHTKELELQKYDALSFIERVNSCVSIGDILPLLSDLHYSDQLWFVFYDLGALFWKESG
jgi:hypothetical protein